MQGASVPVAPVDEDSDLPASERYVGGSSESGYRAYMDPIAEPARVEEGAHRELRTRVLGTVCDHRAASVLVGGPRLDHALMLRLLGCNRLRRDQTYRTEVLGIWINFSNTPKQYGVGQAYRLT